MEHPHVARAGSRPRASVGTWLAVAAVLLINAAFVLNNLGPYLGLNYAGAMTMYSGLIDTGYKHLFMPNLALSGAGTYVSVLQVEAARDRGVAGARLFERLATREGDERPLVHLDLLRYHASRACAAAPTMRLKLRLQTEAGRLVESDDVCADPELQRYAVVSSYPPCRNRSCSRVFARWEESVGMPDR